MADDGPALVLVGHGVGDSLQLTLEGQRALTASGHVYVMNPPPALAKYLGALRLGITDLGERFDAGPDYASAYLDVADFVLRRAATDPPAVLLVPGNPLFQNSLARFFVQTAKERKLAVEIYPGVSIVDTLISDLGLDVTVRGLQVFDARHLVGLGHTVNPRVPLFVLEVGGMVPGQADGEGVDEERAYAALPTHLARFYTPEHLVTLITKTTGRGQLVHGTVRLSRFNELGPQITLDSALFLDAVPVRTS